MSHPFPSRRSIHASPEPEATGTHAGPAQTGLRAQELPPDSSGAAAQPAPALRRRPSPGSASPVSSERATGSLPSDPPQPRRRSQVARDGRGSLFWAIGTALVSIVLVVGVVTAGHAAYQQSQPPVIAVEGPLDAVTVTGRQGAQPVLTVEREVDVHSTKMRVETRGEGREILPDGPVLLSVTAFSGETGANLNPEGMPNLILGSASQSDLGTLLSTILTGVPEGSRLVVARPLDDGTTEVDVIDVLYTIAKGDVVDDSTGPLSVIFTDDGPIVSHQEGQPPGALVVQVLNEGTGAQVHSGDAVAVQYIAGTWMDGRIIGSTWSAGMPAMIALDQSMPGVRDALVDHRVGSRLAVTIPAEMATGEDTLFVVVDILGTMPAANTNADIEKIGLEDSD